MPSIRPCRSMRLRTSLTFAARANSLGGRSLCGADSLAAKISRNSRGILGVYDQFLPRHIVGIAEVDLGRPPSGVGQISNQDIDPTHLQLWNTRLYRQRNQLHGD